MQVSLSTTDFSEMRHLLMRDDVEFVDLVQCADSSVVSHKREFVKELLWFYFAIPFDTFDHIGQVKNLLYHGGNISVAGVNSALKEAALAQIKQRVMMRMLNKFLMDLNKFTKGDREPANTPQRYHELPTQIFRTIRDEMIRNRQAREKMIKNDTSRDGARSDKQESIFLTILKVCDESGVDADLAYAFFTQMHAPWTSLDNSRYVLLRAWYMKHKLNGAPLFYKHSAMDLESITEYELSTAGLLMLVEADSFLNWWKTRLRADKAERNLAEFKKLASRVKLTL